MPWCAYDPQCNYEQVKEVCRKHCGLCGDSINNVFASVASQMESFDVPASDLIPVASGMQAVEAPGNNFANAPRGLILQSKIKYER